MQWSDDLNRDWIDRSDLPHIPLWKVAAWLVVWLFDAAFTFLSGVLGRIVALLLVTVLVFGYVVTPLLLLTDAATGWIEKGLPRWAGWLILLLGAGSIWWGRRIIGDFFTDTGEAWNQAVARLENQLSRLRHRLPPHFQYSGPFANVVAVDEAIWPLDNLDSIPRDRHEFLRWVVVPGYDGYYYLHGED